MLVSVTPSQFVTHNREGSGRLTTWGGVKRPLAQISPLHLKQRKSALHMTFLETEESRAVRLGIRPNCALISS